MKRASQRGTGIDWEAVAAAWERWESVLMHSLGSVNSVLFRQLDLRPGQRVLDLGCGAGDPTLDLARHVGPRGTVVGVDVAASMIEVARRRARHFGIRNARFERRDMCRVRSERLYDRVVSRFGLMFADDPEAALASMRGCLRRGGVLAVAVWGTIDENPAHLLRSQIARPYLAEPPPDPETSPHPMRFGRRGVLPRLFRKAGFRNVRAEAVTTSMVFQSLEECVRFQREIPLSDVYRSVTGAERQRLDRRLGRAFRRFGTDPVLRVPGKAWVVRGNR